MTLIADVFPKLRTPKYVVKQMSKKSRSRGYFDRQDGKGGQQCWNLNETNFTIFLDHCQGNCFGNNLS